MIVGYGRASSDEYNEDEQRKHLLKLGCEKIFWDTASFGVANRQGLNKMLNFFA